MKKFVQHPIQKNLTAVMMMKRTFACSVRKDVKAGSLGSSVTFVPNGSA